jgi:hypothetical protein
LGLRSDLVHRFAKVLGVHVAVSIGRELDVGVAQNALDDVNVHAGALQEGSCCVPKGVEVHFSLNRLGPELHPAIWASPLCRIGAADGIGRPVPLAPATDMLPTVNQARFGEGSAESFVRSALLRAHSSQLIWEDEVAW